MYCLYSSRSSLKFHFSVKKEKPEVEKELTSLYDSLICLKTEGKKIEVRDANRCFNLYL